jgi:hypothetical protein
VVLMMCLEVVVVLMMCLVVVVLSLFSVPCTSTTEEGGVDAVHLIGVIRLAVGVEEVEGVDAVHLIGVIWLAVVVEVVVAEVVEVVVAEVVCVMWMAADVEVEASFNGYK